MNERDTELMYAGISAARVITPARKCLTCPARLSPSNERAQCRRCQARDVYVPDAEPKVVRVADIPPVATKRRGKGRTGGLWEKLCDLKDGDALEIPCRDVKHREDTGQNLKKKARGQSCKLSTRVSAGKLYAWLERGGASAR